MMKKETLDTAVRVAQMLKLMAPLAAASKPFSKRLSKLRSGLDEQLVLCLLAAESAQGLHAPGAIAELDKALRDSMVEWLNVQGLLDNPHAGFNAARKARIADVHAVLASAEAVSYETTQHLNLDQSQRSQIIRDFTSTVHNSNWLGTLMHVGLTAGIATTHSASLARKHSSEQGRDLLMTKMLRLCPTYVEAVAPARKRSTKASTSTARTSRPPAVPAAGLYMTQVVMAADALLKQPDIAALADTTFLSVENQSLAVLLEKAAKPVVVGEGETPDTVAQRIVDELLVGLVARNKAIAAEKQAVRQRAQDAAKATALDALKQLNPKVLKLLKDNPDLLKSV
jgi:hypothetical protein